MKSLMLPVFVFVLCTLFQPTLSAEKSALKIKPSVDFMSAYNWRALDVGNSPVLQPQVSTKYKNFEFQFWASQSLSARFDHDGKKVPFTEVDLVLKYNIQTDIGTFTPYFTDFFYPYKNIKYFNYKNYEFDNSLNKDVSKGGHWFNIAMKYKGTKAFPIEIVYDHCFYNDPDKPHYLEFSYPLYVDGVKVKPVLGMTFGKSETYEVKEDKFNVINVGVSVEHKLKISDSFSLPIGTAMIINPYKEKLYFVFKLSLK